MPFPVVPLIAAGASMVGAYLQNKQAAAEAQRNRDFQERMSSTAYQRATADMRLAGINPMLAYMQGGASSPGGAQANVEDIVGPAVSSAQHGSRLANEVKLLAAQRDLADAQAFAARQAGVSNFMTSQEAKARIFGMGFDPTPNGLADGSMKKFGENDPRWGLEAQRRAMDLGMSRLQMPYLRNKAWAESLPYFGKGAGVARTIFGIPFGR